MKGIVTSWMIVVLAKQIGWMLSLCKSVVEDMYLQRLEIVTPTWLRIGWTYVGLTLSLLSPTWSCLLDLRWTYPSCKSNMLDLRWTYVTPTDGLS